MRIAPLCPSGTLQVLDNVPRQLRLTGALRLLPRRGGWLTVHSGRVWLTVTGAHDDQVLHAGDSLWLAPHAAVVAEAWPLDTAVNLRWTLAAEPHAARLPVSAAPASAPSPVTNSDTVAGNGNGNADWRRPATPAQALWPGGWLRSLARHLG